MELEFKKVGSRYEAEFEATGNFNLQIERKKRGGLAIYQKKSADDKYASESSYSETAEAVVNKDFSMLIFPKFIKVVSGSEVTKAVVTMEGEASEGGTGTEDNPFDYERYLKVTAYDYDDQFIKEVIVPEVHELGSAEFNGRNPKMLKFEAFYVRNGADIKYTPKNAFLEGNETSTCYSYMRQGIINGDFCITFIQRLWSSGEDVNITTTVDGIYMDNYLQVGK